MARKSRLEQRRSKLSAAQRALLAKRLKGRRKAEPEAKARAVAERLARRPDPTRAPMSFAQERLWHWARERPDSAIHNVYHMVRLTGPLNVPALQWSLDEIVRRHEVLRMRFTTEDDKPVAVIEPSFSPQLPILDLAHMEKSFWRTRGLAQIARSAAGVPFDVERGPLMSLVLIRLEEQQHILLILVHHIVIDGFSLLLMVRELASLYPAACEHRGSDLPELEVRYGDFAAWQRQRVTGEELRQEIDYWRHQLAGCTPELNLPGRVDEPPAGDPRGASQALVLSPRLSQAIRALARRARGTLFITLLAAFVALLHRLSGQRDLIVGTPAAGRGRQEIESLVGFFLNMLPLRVRLDGVDTFLELLAKVREVAAGAYAHQELPFEYLLQELDLAPESPDEPFFRTVFNLPAAGAGEDGPLNAADLQVEPITTGEIGSEFELLFYAVEQQDGIRIQFGYHADVFDHRQMLEMIEDYRRLLQTVTEDPERRLSEI